MKNNQTFLHKNQKKVRKSLVIQKKSSTFAPHLRESAAVEATKPVNLLEVWVSG